MGDELRNLLREGAAEVGAPLEEEQAEKLLLYLEKIREGNEVMNLTSTSEPRELILKHLVDSLSCVPLLPPDLRCSSYRCGEWGGFSGIGPEDISSGHSPCPLGFLPEEVLLSRIPGR